MEAYTSFTPTAAPHGRRAPAQVAGAGRVAASAPARQVPAWSTAPTQVGARVSRTLRRPEAVPQLRQLMGVCGWAAVLGGVGLVLGIRGLIGVLAGDPPSWYEPSTIVAGAVGIALTVGSFLTVQRAKAPWVLLSCASVSLVLAMVFTSVAF